VTSADAGPPPSVAPVANGIFDAFKTALLTSAAVTWTADHRVILGDAADDDPDLATDDFEDDIAGAAEVAVSSALASPTAGSTGAGQADADNVDFGAVTGDQAEWLVIYQHTGTPTTSELVLKLDSGVTGLPVLPNGGPITITWGAYIFSVAA